MRENPFARGGGQPVLEGPDEVLVHGMGLVVTRLARLNLRFEPTPLLANLQKARAERAKARRQLSKLIEKCELPPPPAPAAPEKPQA